MASLRATNRLPAEPAATSSQQTQEPPAARGGAVLREWHAHDELHEQAPETYRRLARRQLGRRTVPANMSVPIRRSIRVSCVRTKLRSCRRRNASAGKETAGQAISLDQPVERYLRTIRHRPARADRRVGPRRQRHYWRPVLELNVGPDAQLTLNASWTCCKDSGVDIQVPETLKTPHKSSGGVTR